MKKWISGIIATVIAGVALFIIQDWINTNEGDLPPPETPCPITISYALDDMVEARAIVYIENKEVGNLVVSENRVYDSFDLTLPRAGEYSYSVQARMEIMMLIDLDTMMEAPAIYDSNGEGIIFVEPGKEFIVTTNNMTLSSGGGQWYAQLLDKALEDN
jgi:hypothetical protein